MEAGPSDQLLFIIFASGYDIVVYMDFFKRGGQPTWWVSLLPFVFLVSALAVVIYVFGTDALSGGSQVALMLAAGFAVVLAMVLYKIPWKTFEDAILDNITSVGTSIVILLLIGAVSGSWMVSGVVPTMIWLGFISSSVSSSAHP